MIVVKGIREPHEAKKKSFDLGGNAKHKTRSGPAQQPFELGWQEGGLNALLEHEPTSMDPKIFDIPVS